MENWGGHGVERRVLVVLKGEVGREGRRRGEEKVDEEMSRMRRRGRKGNGETMVEG